MSQELAYIALQRKAAKLLAEGCVCVLCGGLCELGGDTQPYRVWRPAYGEITGDPSREVGWEISFYWKCKYCYKALHSHIHVLDADPMLELCSMVHSIEANT